MAVNARPPRGGRQREAHEEPDCRCLGSQGASRREPGTVVFLCGLGQGSPPRGWGRRPLVLGRSRGRRGKPSSPVLDGPPGGYRVMGSKRKRNCAAATVLQRQNRFAGRVPKGQSRKTDSSQLG